MEETPHPRLAFDREHETLRCPECGAPAILVPARGIYWTFSKGTFWACKNFPKCHTYVGCHDGTDTPLGTMAGPELRKARRELHPMFDQLWARKMDKEGCSKTQARTAAYFWLAKRMGITIQECHIAKFTMTQCTQAVAICWPYVKQKDTGRAPSQPSLDI